jgi:hypothetical protein
MLIAAALIEGIGFAALFYELKLKQQLQRLVVTIVFKIKTLQIFSIIKFIL